MTNGVRSTSPDLSDLPRLARLPDPDALPAMPGAGGLADRQRSFAGVLSRAASHPGPPASPEAQARESAEQFVAITFLQPLLQQLRAGNHAAAPFAPSQGEKQMQSLMDAETATRLAKAQRWPLVDRIAKDLLRKAPAELSPRAQAGVE